MFLPWPIQKSHIMQELDQWTKKWMSRDVLTTNSADITWPLAVTVEPVAGHFTVGAVYSHDKTKIPTSRKQSSVVSIQYSAASDMTEWMSCHSRVIKQSINKMHESYWEPKKNNSIHMAEFKGQFIYWISKVNEKKDDSHAVGKRLLLSQKGMRRGKQAVVSWYSKTNTQRNWKISSLAAIYQSDAMCPWNWLNILHMYHKIDSPGGFSCRWPDRLDTSVHTAVTFVFHSCFFGADYNLLCRRNQIRIRQLNVQKNKFIYLLESLTPRADNGGVRKVAH